MLIFLLKKYASIICFQIVSKCSTFFVKFLHNVYENVLNLTNFPTV